MARQWIYDNLNVDDYWMGYDVIDWGNMLFTEIDGFINLFGETIEQAIKDNKDVRQAIANQENAGIIAELILN